MNIKYRLESIKETEYRFNYDFDYESIQPDGVGIRIGHEFKPSIDDDRIVICTKVIVVSNETDTVLVTNAISVAFGLSPMKDIISFDSKGRMTTQNSLILDTFIVATVGAMRGVLMKNLKGTPLEFVTIPLIPIESFRVNK